MAVTDFANVGNHNKLEESNKGDFFQKIARDENFVGNLYELDYGQAKVLLNDYDKNQVKGVPLGCFLVAIYSNELRENETEGILLRVVGIAEIPQTKEIMETLTNAHIDRKENRKEILEPDAITKYFYQFSGLLCRVLGTFYVEQDKLVFGTDIENFLGAHHYRVYKPQKTELNTIVNENTKDSNHLRQQIGKLRYASSQSYDKGGDYAPDVYLRVEDVVARRSAFFGMTRTGKSNTIKIVVMAIEKLNQERNKRHEPQIGQIIFDVNGEYTFANQQDNTCIHDKLKDKALRFSTSASKVKDPKHEGVWAIQYDFYKDETLEESFELLCDEIMLLKRADYFKAFMGVRMFEDDTNEDKKRANQRKRAIYKCILYRAKFGVTDNYRVRFNRFNLADKKQDEKDKESYKPHEGFSLEEACQYFEKLDLANLKEKYKDDKDYEALLKVLQATHVSGYKALMGLSHLHSNQGGEDHKKIIDQALRMGKVVLVDLSTASTQMQEKYITRLCGYIFAKSMEKFTNDQTPEFIQMYFEEAHNIFPKDDKDLKNIYNRLAKEGAKINIGISYSTQEVSAIAPSILKNTQNWFISHLNNKDEIKVLEKYYDFSDFSQSIIRNNDVGFARIKTYSNNFIIPVQIDRFKD
ncbi:ATP-binding protein [Helicobacter labacensis]|uniref:ATP-binding protein n=1 Tax=Helicobacter labacensis TaxID=2316079 RepID=UPI000EB5A687|nr:DUF87 domain-containing protein [Helicobacter labacensis]